MAVLSDNARQGVWADLMQELSIDRDPVSITKADLRAAVNALDDFLHNNATAINNAIPQPARGALTTSQKSRILRTIMRYRYEGGI